MTHHKQRVIWSDEANDLLRSFDPDHESFAAFTAREFPDKEYASCFMYYSRNIAPMLGRAKTKSMRVDSFFDSHMLLAKSGAERKALVEYYGREEEEEKIPPKRVRTAPPPLPISIAAVAEVSKSPPPPEDAWTEVEDAIIRGWRLEPVFLCSVIPHRPLNEIHQRRKHLSSKST